MTDKKNNGEHIPEENLPKSEQTATETVAEEAGDKDGMDETDKHKASRKGKKDKSHEKIEELSSKLEELSDRHLRLQAEFDNYRKRTLKEKAELVKAGGESVLTAILPIIDDFDRALAAMAEISDDDHAKMGFLLIFSKFKDFLRVNSVTEIEAAGKDFDVDLHEAITKLPAPTPELKGKIVDVIQKGYLMNGKVIRFAKVVIGD